MVVSPSHVASGDKVWRWARQDLFPLPAPTPSDVLAALGRNLTGTDLSLLVFFVHAGAAGLNIMNAGDLIVALHWNTKMDSFLICLCNTQVHFFLDTMFDSFFFICFRYVCGVPRQRQEDVTRFGLAEQTAIMVYPGCSYAMSSQHCYLCGFAHSAGPG